jgi:hypothetical protein
MIKHFREDGATTTWAERIVTDTFLFQDYHVRGTPVSPVILISLLNNHFP